MPDIKGTKTEKNLLTSFAGEAQARNRYTMYAEVAQKEGYDQIAAIFLETASNEYQHAKRFFSLLEGGTARVDWEFPAGPVGNTIENLTHAAEGEHEEWSDMYPSFAQIAEEEGFHKVATIFNIISKVEKHHEARYRKLLENVVNGTVFKKESDKTLWKCRACGYIHEGKEALAVCPSCLEKQEQFELLCESF